MNNRNVNAICIIPKSFNDELSSVIYIDSDSPRTSNVRINSYSNKSRNVNKIIKINENDTDVVNNLTTQNECVNENINEKQKGRKQKKQHTKESKEKTTQETSTETSKDLNMILFNEKDINIYRYKFSQEFIDELFNFSKIHQYDHRKDFKEAWNKWSEENDELISREIRRLVNLGYDGDIYDKMFKSARYYYRKKSPEKKEPAKRRNYVGIQKHLLDNMDEHINKNYTLPEYKPASGFDDFCKTYIDDLKEEVLRLYKDGMKDHNEIKEKIKKTYKNRYFIIAKRENIEI